VRQPRAAAASTRCRTETRNFYPATIQSDTRASAPRRWFWHAGCDSGSPGGLGM